jgi:hypothetical protein
MVEQVLAAGAEEAAYRLYRTQGLSAGFISSR